MNAKLKNNSILTRVEIQDLDLGDHAPKATGVRLIKGMTPDYAVLGEVDLVYKGGASMALQGSLTGGINIPVRIYLNALAGRVRVRWPALGYSDMIGFAFVEDPGVTFTIDAPLSLKTSEAVRNMVNRFLGSLVRKIFLEMWVLPSWRRFYMPLMQPVPLTVSFFL
jgi:hypothetical protein